VKLYSEALWLVSLAACTLLFAASTSAQDLAQIINKLRPPKPFSADASSGPKSQSAHQKAVTPDATVTCTYTFTSGSGATYMKYCVTVNGTLAGFESPSGVEMLDQSGAFEGYGICDATTGTAYWDYNHDDSGNWNAPVKATSNATEVKIERSTVDSAWLLTQTITKVSGSSPAANIVMALKNTSGEAKVAVLVRFAGFAPDKAASSGDYGENYDGSDDSVWGYIPNFAGYSTSSAPYGLMLQTVGAPTPASTFALGYGYGYNNELGPDPCNATGVTTEGNPITPGTVIGGAGAGAYLYVLALNKNQTSTATLRYFRF
jgi:hypothetical protein